jgi:hypothetical protein
MIGPEKVAVELDPEHIESHISSKKNKKVKAFIEAQVGIYEEGKISREAARHSWLYSPEHHIDIHRTHGLEKWDVIDKFSSIRGALDSMVSQFELSSSLWHESASARRVVDSEGKIHKVWYPKLTNLSDDEHKTVWHDTDDEELDLSVPWIGDRSKNQRFSVDWTLVKMKGWYCMWPSRGETLLTYTEITYKDWRERLYKLRKTVYDR